MKKLITLVSLVVLGHFAMGQNPFPALNVDLYDATKFPKDLDEVLIPASPLKYEVIFTGGVDEVVNHKGETALAKEWQDFTSYVPINGRSDSGYLVVNHERVQRDSINGDGGGMTVFTVYYNQATKKWEVVNDPKGKFRNVDFSEVGGTGANCGGIQTSWGQVWTAEEWGDAFTSNAVLTAQGMSDTSDFTIETFNGTTVNRTVPRNMNFQYMVEIDVKAAKAVRKNYNMGRYDHEGGWIASDRRTVYLTDDYSGGAIFFKFVADVPEDFSKGKLYAYKQSADAMSGSWVALPMTLDAMLDARNEAFKLGATTFMRLEWVEGINDNTIFIAETGRGKSQSVKSSLAKGATLAHHLMQLDANDGKIDSTYTDMWGRILRLNIATGKMEVALEGGGNLKEGYTPTNNHLSSPDGLASVQMDGRVYLVINEDMNPSKNPANPAHFSTVVCETYILDVTGDEPGKTYNVDQLTRFMVGPKGCEITGGRFTPDGSTYFVNIQHPAADNKAPFNHSVTMAISGYKDIFNQSYMNTLGIDELNAGNEAFVVYPNPATRELHFNKVTDVAVYSMDGKRVMVRRDVQSLDISSLERGTYVVINADNQAKKIIVQ